jgi:protein-S-isoprenylcysteine O-methyltransferase Ste14
VTQAAQTSDHRYRARLLVAAASIAVVLLGWGIGDLDGFGREPARVVATAVVAAGLFGASGALRVPKERTAEARWQIVVAMLSLALIAVELFLFPRLDARLDSTSPLRADTDWLRWIGVVAGAAGLALQNWAIISLGRWFTLRVALLPGHELVRAGPYRLLRHPSYTGLFLWLLGIPLAFGSWGGVVVLAVALPFAILRMREEEALLQREFGPSFDAMQRETYRLVPYVY